MSEIRPTIAVGFRVGMLTVEKRTAEKKNGYSVWLCRCDCGGEIKLDTRCLQRGTVRDCGCVTKAKPGTTDITGMRFGKLVALEQTDERKNSGSAVWLCKCDCGNICKASFHQLRAGYRKSCGCLSHPPLKDFVGKKFGMLTVLEYAGKPKGMHQWKCKCDCGNEAFIGQTRLQNGKTKSCGCMQSKAFLNNTGITEGTSVSILEYYKTHMSPLNTSGYTGVYQDKKTGKWSAQIGFKGKTHHLGRFSNKADAIAARQRGEEMIDDFLESFYIKNPNWKQRKEMDMNKKELIAEIAKRTSTTQKEAEKGLNTFCEIIREELVANRKVQITGFGIFEVRERAARIGKNPRTGETVEIQATKAPSFKAGKVLKDSVNVE